MPGCSGEAVWCISAKSIIKVLEEMYGDKLDKEEAIEAARGRFEYIDSNLDEFEELGYATGYLTPTQYEDGKEYEKYKAQVDKLHISEKEVESS